MFSFFKRKPSLRSAIAALNANRTVANNIDFQKTLVSSILYVSAEDVPEEWKGTQVLDQDISLRVLTSAAPNGGVALLCFSDVAEVRARTGKENCFGLRLDTINDLVKRNGYAGIIINPNGPWAGVSAADLSSLAARVDS